MMLHLLYFYISTKFIFIKSKINHSKSNIQLRNSIFINNSHKIMVMNMIMCMMTWDSFIWIMVNFYLSWWKRLNIFCYMEKGFLIDCIKNPVLLVIVLQCTTQALILSLHMILSMISHILNILFFLISTIHLYNQ